jgi:hypothetical protein
MERLAYNKILYIGEEAKDCLYMIEQFNNCLLGIEKQYTDWFLPRPAKHPFELHDKLKNYIYYHFEGGIAAFNFRHRDELPREIINECVAACAQITSYQNCFAA